MVKGQSRLKSTSYRIGPSTCLIAFGALYKEWDAAWVENFEARVEYRGLMVTKLETKSIPLVACTM